jgi:hypothetical protein
MEKIKEVKQTKKNKKKGFEFLIQNRDSPFFVLKLKLLILKLTNMKPRLSNLNKNILQRTTKFFLFKFVQRTWKSD